MANYMSLFKVRICSLIAFSAVAGYMSVNIGHFSWKDLSLLVVVTMFASMASSAFNHYYDRDIDSLMTRTRKRPLATGDSISPSTALFAAIGLLVLSIAISFLALNAMVALHLGLGAIVYGFIYTVWLKRRTWLNIVVGGLAGSFSVLAGGASHAPELCVPPILLAIIMFLWTPSHFWSFAMLHKKDYEAAGIPMLPALVGDRKTAVYMLVNTTLLFIASLLPFFLGYSGWIYLLCAAVPGAYFLWSNVLLIKDQSTPVLRKNFLISMGYLGILLIGLMADSAF
ncbi:MAG: heme o synthase [Thermodesulfobacteriota bacterium]